MIDNTDIVYVPKLDEFMNDIWSGMRSSRNGENSSKNKLNVATVNDDPLHAFVEQREIGAVCATMYSANRIMSDHAPFAIVWLLE